MERTSDERESTARSFRLPGARPCRHPARHRRPAPTQPPPAHPDPSVIAHDAAGADVCRESGAATGGRHAPDGLPDAADVAR